MKKFITPTIFLLALLPALLLLLDTLTDNLSANPIEEITQRSGAWALRFLLLTLMVTPLKTVQVFAWLGPLRRMFGLYSFFYALLHFSTYLALDHFFNFDGVLEDIIERPYITVGFLAFVLLIPLALTSTNSIIKRLGAKRWKRLHQSIYAIGIFAVLHYLWLVKADLREPLIYAALLLLLLLYRLYKSWQRRKLII